MNTIYEITQLMENKNIIQNDLNEAVNTVKSIFHDKYIQKFQMALEEQKDIAKSQSSKEIELLNALKPFMNEKFHANIDKLTDIILSINTVSCINKEIKKYSTPIISSTMSSNTTIHEDGIYEIDESCKRNNFLDNNINITEIIFMLLLVGII